MDIGQVVDNLFQGKDEVPESKKHELRNHLLSAGYEYGVIGPGIYSRKEDSHTHILIEANLSTGRDGYSYTEILNAVQMESFRQANENIPLTAGQKTTFIVSALAPIAGTLYALNDLPYSAYVAGACFLTFIAGFRVATGLMFRSQYENSSERFNMHNFVTDQREAILRALSNR